jgi:hypothetical protein
MQQAEFLRLSWREPVISRKGAKTQRSFWQAVDHSLDPILDAWHTKVDEQAQPFVGYSQVGEQLFVVRRA